MKYFIPRVALVFLLSLSLAFSASSALAASGDEASLYERLRGFDAISAVVDDVVVQIAADDKLRRFWAHRGNDGITRQKELIVDLVVARSGGPLYYTGREMKLSREGMHIDEQDWDILIGALKNTLEKFNVPAKEAAKVLSFFDNTKKDIVEKS